MDSRARRRQRAVTRSCTIRAAGRSARARAAIPCRARRWADVPCPARPRQSRRREIGRSRRAGPREGDSACLPSACFAAASIPSAAGPTYARRQAATAQSARAPADGKVGPMSGTVLVGVGLGLEVHNQVAAPFRPVDLQWSFEAEDIGPNALEPPLAARHLPPDHPVEGPARRGSPRLRADGFQLLRRRPVQVFTLRRAVKAELPPAVGGAPARALVVHAHDAPLTRE